MFQVSPIPPGQQHALRSLRLSALKDSPGTFFHTFAEERAYSDAQWAAEFARGDWYAGLLGDRPISLLGTTREKDTPCHECYLEFLWVHKKHRRSGIALKMLNEVLGLLHRDGVRTAYLWIMDGNAPAASLYKRVGFVSTGQVQPLPGRDGRTEERLRLDLPRRR